MFQRLVRLIRQVRIIMRRTLNQKNIVDILLGKPYTLGNNYKVTCTMGI